MSGFKWPNPFLANVPILYHPKTPDKESFSGVISGYKIGPRWVKIKPILCLDLKILS